MPYAGGVRFRVWAPFAQAVYLEGEVAGSERILMNNERQRESWFLDVPGATPGSKYHYVIDNGIEELIRPDPYCQLVSETTWPVDSIVHEPEFDWQGWQYIDDYYDFYHMVIHQIHIGSFSDEGSQPKTFFSAMEKLDYLVALGVTAVELLPVTETSIQGSLGFSPTFVMAIETDYGGPDGLKTFVREAHKRNLTVIIDLIFDHLNDQENSLLKFDWYDENYDKGIYFFNKGDFQDGSLGARPNYDEPHVRQLFLDSVIRWIVDYGIDGFRITNTVCIRKPSR